jgi:V/A-type H+-transporting ATPase subunit C
MPKITVEKLKLIEPKKISNFVGMSLHHISSELEKTPYRTEIRELGLKELNSISLEDALLKNFLKTCKMITELSPKDIGILLSAFLMKFEANCLKTILKTKKANLSVEESMNYIVPAGRLSENRCRKTLENSENIGDVIDSLQDLDYGSILENAFEVYMKEKIFYLLEVAIDRHIYNELWGATEKLWGMDKRIARTIIGLEIDAVNVKVIFRCKAMGISRNEIKRYILPVSEMFGEKELEEAIRCSDIHSAIDSLLESAKRAGERDHRYVFKEIQESNITSLTELETILDRGLLETNLRILKRYTPFFNIGLLLAFLNLKWFEVKNLRAIIRGSEARIAPDRVKKLLILQR